MDAQDVFLPKLGPEIWGYLDIMWGPAIGDASNPPQDLFGLQTGCEERRLHRLLESAIRIR